MKYHVVYVNANQRIVSTIKGAGHRDVVALARNIDERDQRRDR